MVIKVSWQIICDNNGILFVVVLLETAVVWMQNDPFLYTNPILVIFRIVPLRQDSDRKDWRQRSMIPSVNLIKGSENLDLIIFAQQQQVDMLM